MNTTFANAAIRKAAFDWLRDQVQRYGDVLPRKLLQQGFVLNDERIRLVGPQGIFKPKVLELPLSITTVPSGPYDDGYSPDGLLLYRYRGSDPNHRDNAGLRTVMRNRVPLIYFHRVVKGKYLAVWPVFIVGDDRQCLTFQVEVDDAQYASPDLDISGSYMQVADSGGEARRAYITATVRQRVHQRSFRERVLRAYQEQCALCRLRHTELLDAAHIIPDGEPDGEPIVPNGLALCKLHHAAFDNYILGIRPDHVVEIRHDILEEFDGPMLQHGLKGMHGKRIFVPRATELRPSAALLERRYERFLVAE